MAVRKSLLHWELAGFLTVCAAGALLHELYPWSGSTLVGAFSSVNESTWEHMKLLFIPYFVFTMLQFTVFAEPFRNYFAAKAAAGLAGLLLIPALHYSLTGMLGTLPPWVDIASFFVAAAVMYLISYRLLTTLALRGAALQLLGFALLWGLLFAFIYFTYRPPALPLFQDPTTLQYGISQ